MLADVSAILCMPCGQLSSCAQHRVEETAQQGTSLRLHIAALFWGPCKVPAT